MSEYEFAAEARCNVRTVRRWRAIGYGPRFVKLGRKVFYLADSTRDFLAKLQTGGAQELQRPRRRCA